MNEKMRKDVTDMLAIFTAMPATLLKGLCIETEHRINFTQKKTLLFIYQHEGMPMNYYSKMANLESGSFTYAAKGLEEKGLIKRVESFDDHRKTGLVLTAKGRKTAARMYKMMEAHVYRRLDALTEEERRRFYSAIRVLYDTKMKVETSV
jgi:DNA-binding MarR family transcriptional regulator